MSNKPVWMETWDADGNRVDLCDPMDRGVVLGALASFGTSLAIESYRTDDDTNRARLAAAAPALVRALLAVEWLEEDPDPYPSYLHCVACGASTLHAPKEHERGCTTDAALTAAGFPDQASRDEARRMMAEAKR